MSPLFRNKRFSLNEMFQRNTSKFAIFLRADNPDERLKGFVVLLTCIYFDLYDVRSGYRLTYLPRFTNTTLLLSLG